jgi:iron complex transport system substrate-binding protein
MRVCSFLPSATEILFALGVGGEVVGVTFECDFPAEAEGKAIVVKGAMQSGLSPREIDDAVRATVAEGGSLYFVEWELLETLRPELIVTQDLCRVCAISAPGVAREIGQLGSQPEVVSLSPHTLSDVFADIAVVGRAVGRVGEAEALVGTLRGRVEAVRGRVERLRAAAGGKGLRPRVLCLEWLDPLYQGGHWIPEMVELAGGEAVLAVAGEKSVRLRWEDVLAADPEVIVLMPCGYHLRETMEQVRTESWEANLPAGWQDVSAVRNGEIYAVDGTAYFSRPGPRLVDGLEILEAILGKRGFENLPPESVPPESVARLSL